MTISVLLTLRIEHARSLKDRRAVVRSLVERLRVRKQVSAAEVGLQDRIGEAQVGFAVVSGDRATARHLVDDMRRFVDLELLGRAEVVATTLDETVLE